MILTGKCKEKFLSEYYKESIKNNWDLNELEYIFNMLPKTCQNALIIEFFDEQTNREYDFYFQEIYLECLKDGYLHESIRNIQEQAIKKANDLYNNTDKV